MVVIDGTYDRGAAAIAAAIIVARPLMAVIADGTLFAPPAGRPLKA